MTPEELEQLEEQLSAYVDGELTPEQRSQVEAALESSPEARERLEELRQVSRFVGQLPRGEAPEDLQEVLFARLEREQLFDSAETPTLAPATPPGALSFGRLIGAAAVILLAVLTGYLTIDFVQESRRPLEVADAGNDQQGGPTGAAPRETPAAPVDDSVANKAEQPPDEAAPRTSAELAPLPAKKKRSSLEDTAAVAKAGKPGPAKLRAADAGKRGPEPKDLGYVSGARTRADKKPASPERAMAQGKVSLPEAQPVTKRGTPPPDKIASKRPAKAKPSAKTDEVTQAPAPPPRPEQSAEAEPTSTLDRVVAMLADRFVEKIKEGSQSAKSEDKAAPPSPTIASQLRQGVRLAELRADRVHDEAVQITLTAETSSEQNELAWALRAYMARHQIDDAELLGGTARLNESQAFYFTQRVKPEQGPPTPQFVVRATPEQLASLVEDVGRSAPRNTQVALVTPEVQTSGWRRSIAAAQTLQTQTPPTRLAAQPQPTTGPRPAGESGPPARRFTRGKPSGGYGGRTDPAAPGVDSSTPGEVLGPDRDQTLATAERSSATAGEAKRPEALSEAKPRSTRSMPSKKRGGTDKGAAPSARARWLARGASPPQAPGVHAGIQPEPRLAAKPSSPPAEEPTGPTPPEAEQDGQSAKDSESDESDVIVLPSRESAAEQPSKRTKGQLTAQKGATRASQSAAPRPRSVARAGPSQRLRSPDMASQRDQQKTLPLGPSDLPEYRQRAQQRSQELVTAVITVRQATLPSGP